MEKQSKRLKMYTMIMRWSKKRVSVWNVVVESRWLKRYGLVLHGQGSHVKCCNEVVNRCDAVSLGVRKDEEMSCNELLERVSEMFEVKLGVDYGESRHPKSAGLD